MAVEAGLDLHELDELTKQLYRVAEKAYPKEAKKFLSDQGNEGKKILRAEINARVTGHRKRETDDEKKTSLKRGISKGRPYKYQEDWQIRVYDKAPHAYLVEHGHSNVKTRSGKRAIPVGTPVVMVPGRGTAGPLFIGRDGAVKQIEGRYYAAATTNRLKAQFPGEVEKFVDELIDKGLEL